MLLMLLIFFAGIVIGYYLRKYNKTDDVDIGDVVYTSRYGQCYHRSYGCLRKMVSRVENIEMKRRCEKCAQAPGDDSPMPKAVAKGKAKAKVKTGANPLGPHCFDAEAHESSGSE
jgi:hypothetical protein